MNETISLDASAWSRAQELSLIEAVRRGDRQASRALVVAHQDRLFSFVQRTLRNHHDAEEVCQDAFLRAFRSLDTFDSQYRFSTWLFTIAYRLCLNVLRRGRGAAAEIDWTGLPDPQLSVAAESAQSEEADQLKTLVWGAVEELSPPQRAAMLLFYQHSLGCTEISQVLQVPVATVKSHLHRGRLKLKELLEPTFGEESARMRLLGELAG